MYLRKSHLRHGGLLSPFYRGRNSVSPRSAHALQASLLRLEAAARQPHLSDIGLFTPLGRARNSMPLRAHSPFSHAFSAFPRQSESTEPPSFDDPSTCNRPGAWERLGVSAKGGRATPQKPAREKPARARLPASQRPRVPLVQRTTFNAQRVTPPHLSPNRPHRSRRCRHTRSRRAARCRR